MRVNAPGAMVENEPGDVEIMDETDILEDAAEEFCITLISRAQLAALKNGKALAFTVEEYDCIVRLDPRE